MHVKKINKQTRNISKSLKGVKYSINKNLKDENYKSSKEKSGCKIP